MSAESVQDYLSRFSSAPFTPALHFKDSILKLSEEYLVWASELYTHELNSTLDSFTSVDVAINVGFVRCTVVNFDGANLEVRVLVEVCNDILVNTFGEIELLVALPDQIAGASALDADNLILVLLGDDAGGPGVADEFYNCVSSHVTDPFQ